MKIKPECLPCLISRTLYDSKLATDDEKIQKEIIIKFCRVVAEKYSADMVPSELGSLRLKTVSEYTNNKDIFLEIKEKSNYVAERFISTLDTDALPLEELIRLSVVANALDFGVAYHSLDLEKFETEFQNILSQRFGIDDRKRLIEQIENSKTILYLLDNCGEFLFDRLLIKRLEQDGKNVIVSAKPEPMINDVTVDIAKKYFNKVVSSGRLVGVDLKTADSSFRHYFSSADLIIAKGMGSYETISEFENTLAGRLVYMLMAKCPPVASALGISEKELAVKSV